MPITNTVVIVPGQVPKTVITTPAAQGPPGAPGTGGGGGSSFLNLSRSGVLFVATGTVRLVATRALTIVRIRAVVATASTGASIILDVNKNGTTVFTTQANRPMIAAGANDSGNVVPNITGLAAGDYITLDVDQVGSTYQGSDVSITIEVT